MKLEKYNLTFEFRKNLLERSQVTKVLPIDKSLIHLKCLESEVYDKRNNLGIKRIYKCVDTCAAEFEASDALFLLDILARF